MMSQNTNRFLLPDPAAERREALADYLSAGGYQAFQKALPRDKENMTEELRISGLRGRGGAGFPTWIKIKAVKDALAVNEKFVVCNADEGEPGTFKDRYLMEKRPHLLIEGMLLAALVCGANKGFIYIRGEYYESISSLQHALQEASDADYLGDNIKGSGFSFSIEVMRGAGSYLCGEELTLIESLEGKRGYPRIKPPFPAEKGLWGEPTLVNNVETLCNLPVIFSMGADKYNLLGTEKSKGTKLVCLSGDINKPGLYETEFGTSISELITEAGGIKTGETPAAVLLGGAAGTFASADLLGTTLCYDAMAQQGLTLGSGAIIVFSKQFSLHIVLGSILKFFSHESCGKCVPCRIGTWHLYQEWMAVKNATTEEKIRCLEKITGDARQIAGSSLCPLGQSPALPLSSALKNLSSFLS